MDSHLAGGAARAAAALRSELPGLTLVVHAADEWGVDSRALDRCLADIARGDIVIASMLFLDDHIRAVLPALQARRETCDAMVACLSAPEVVRLTRMGKLSMSGEASGAMAWLKRLRGSSKPDGKASGQKQMKMLRRMPKLLRFIPGTAQDLRAYFLALQYWLAGSDENLANLVRMLVGRYGQGEREALRGRLTASQPVHYPEVGLYHPHAQTRIVEELEQLPRPASGEAGTVGVLVMRSYVLGGNSAHYDGVLAALEEKGLRVVPAFSSGLDQRPAIERYFTKDGRATVDAIVSLTGFSLVGGPAYNDARAAEEVLAGLDVPYVAAHPVEFQTLEQWGADARGLTPVEATMMVAIPELDGAICPMTFGGRSSEAPGEGRRDMASHPERATTLAARVARLVWLRRTARAERKVAIVLFNFPPNAGATGTAAYLSVFNSLHNTLSALKAAGYRVDLPVDPCTLRSRILEGNASRFGTDANVAARMPVDQHVRHQRWLTEIERQWGPAPGRHNTDGASLFVLGAEFGNVFVGVQPAFGYEGDPMRLLFEGSFAPTHAFCAFYRWVRESFRADAVLHFGTHGALEFMPGKQAGLSAECWPDRLIGDLPNLYLYASNNPSEGALAKRRTGATLISYLTPPVASAGLYRGLLDLKASLDAGAVSIRRRRARAARACRPHPGPGRGCRPRGSRAGLDARRGGTEGARSVPRDPRTRIHADPARPARDRRDGGRDLPGRDFGRGRRDRRRRARPPRRTPRPRPRTACASARARRRLYPAGARRRSSPDDRRPADRPQPARLRSVPDSVGLRDPRRRGPGGEAARPPRGRRALPARDDRPRPLGHGQPEDGGRAHRAGALASRRRAEARQLRPPCRGAACASRAPRPAPD
jgi:magnesium chelatase subunit H